MCRNAPFFGSAAGARGDIETAPDRFAADIEDLLDHLGIECVGLVGHKAGSVYAFAAAARLGDRAGVVVSVAGGVPIISSEQFSDMSARQRLVAYTARYTPKLVALCAPGRDPPARLWRRGQFHAGAL